MRAWLLSLVCLILAGGWCGPRADEGARSVRVVPASGPLAGRTLYANSHALVIGINKYPRLENRSLRFAVRDATDMRDVLVKQYGFPEGNVVLLLDAQATRRGIEDALVALLDRRKVGRDDRVLIYFSGHGQTVKLPGGGEQGFLIPYDGEVDLKDSENIAPYAGTCLSMRSVWERVEACPAKHILVVADACYSGLLATRRVGEEVVTPDALSRLAALRSMQVMTAGGAGEESLEMANLGHGAFTYKVLEQLRARASEPGSVFMARELFTDVRRGVLNVPGCTQNPQMHAYQTEGEFFFVPVGEIHPPAPNPVRIQAEKPQPAAATLRVQSEPAQAEVWVGERRVGTTPCDLSLPAAAGGTAYPVELRKEGYQPSRFRVTVYPGSRGDTGLMRLDRTPGIGIQPEPAQPVRVHPPMAEGADGGVRQAVNVVIQMGSGRPPMRLSGLIDTGAGKVYIRATGLPKAGASSIGQKKWTAREAACIYGMRDLALMIVGMHIGGVMDADDAELIAAKVVGAFEAKVKRGVLYDDPKDPQMIALGLGDGLGWNADDETYTVVMEAPLYGAGSVAEAWCDPQVQAYLQRALAHRPQSLAGVADGSAQGAIAEALANATVQYQDLNLTRYPLVAGGKTGVIVLCEDLGVRVGLTPRLYRGEAGDVVFGTQVPMTVAVEQGIVGYAATEAAARANPRVGSNPIVVKGIGKRGKFGVAVSEADADRLLAENERGSCLDRCAVVFVVE